MKWIWRAVVAGVLVLSSSIVCFAQAGSLSIVCQTDDEGVLDPVSGAEFTIYEVGEYDEETHAFASEYGIDADRLDSGRMGTIAKWLTGQVSDGIRGTTDDSGNVVFRGIPPGIYLAAQTGRRGEAKGYRAADPVLIAIPAENEGALDYDVETFPKLALAADADGDEQEEVEEEDEPASSAESEAAETTVTHRKSQSAEGVQTGDENSQLLELLVLLLTSLLALTVICRLEFGKEESDA